MGIAICKWPWSFCIQVINRENPSKYVTHMYIYILHLYYVYTIVSTSWDKLTTGTVGGVISMINYSTIIGIWWNLNRNIMITENICVIVLTMELITKRWRIMSNYDITQFWYITILVPNYTSYITLNNNILVLRSRIQLNLWSSHCQARMDDDIEGAKVPTRFAV